MSRDWTEHKYCNAENLWLWIDEQSEEIRRRFQDEDYTKSESYKSGLCGRMDMLALLMDWLHENETALAKVAEYWGLTEDAS
jgi:hypothetical protein